MKEQLEKIEKSPSRVIGADNFDLTEQNVFKVNQEMEENLKLCQEDLSDSNEKLRQYAEETFSENKRKLQVLNSVTPREILIKMKVYYDEIVRLEQSGLEEEDIVAQVDNQFPDIMDFYPLLRQTLWGYRLGQKISDLRTKEL